MVCGGEFESSALRFCDIYDAKSDLWVGGPSMLSARSEGDVVELSDGRQWIISGGTSEIYEDGQFKPGPAVPFDARFQCAARIDDLDSVWVSAGQNYIYSWLEDQWEQIGSTGAHNPDHFCGVAHKSDGQIELVVGGGPIASVETATSQIYSFQTQSWRNGPGLPANSAYGAVSLAYGENTFIVIGGWYSDAIWEYDPDGSVFHVREERLREDKYNVAAVLVEDDAA